MRVAKHAIERMRERNISALDVAHVLQHGHKMINRHDENKWTFVDNTVNVYVVTDKELTTVITVFKKEK